MDTQARADRANVQGRRRHAPWWQDASGLTLETMRKSESGRHFGGSRSAGAPYLDTSTIAGSGPPMTAVCVSGASAGRSFGMTGCTFWQTTSWEPSAYELRAPRERCGAKSQGAANDTHTNVYAKPSRSSFACVPQSLRECWTIFALPKLSLGIRLVFFASRVGSWR
jgi:hypothetical protein